MKVYTGAPAAARHYVEAGHGRVDDYYLAEGTGIARRYAAGAGRVRELPPLSGDGYEGWVAGVDPATGDPRGRLRPDDRAVRFVEVVVNVPKSWSLWPSAEDRTRSAAQAMLAESYRPEADRSTTGDR